MGRKAQVSFATKLLSNNKYLREVPVEGKKSHRFFRLLGLYDLYTRQVIRTGNCITLVSNPLSITVQSFWNPHYLEDITRHVFWTFNKSFRWMLTEQIQNLKPSILYQCAELLRENPQPYQEQPLEEMDEELRWCIVKNNSLQRSGAFKHMYDLDQQNREALLQALETEIASFSTSTETTNEPVKNEIPSFLDLLNTDNPEEILAFMKDKVASAEFGYDIFVPVQKLENGKNPYGFNGRVAALIDFFYQHNYFKPGYSLEQIFKAYLNYSGNKIGKLSTFFSEFRQDSNYRKYFEKLKALKIDKLQ